MFSRDFIKGDRRYEEDASKYNKWVNLKIACPNKNCTSRMDMCNWVCQKDDQKLFLSSNGIIECRNEKGRHSGRVIDWVFFHGDCSADPLKCEIHIPRLCRMLTKCANSEFTKTLRHQLIKQIKTGPQGYRLLKAVAMDGDIDEQANVELFEYVDIQKIDFTKRSPPSLFEKDRISDSAKDTCNTIVGGFVMTVSQNILSDGYLDTESYRTTETSSKMLLDITRKKNIWCKDRNKEMFHRILKIETLLTAIKQKDHDEVMRIYYRSQHIHTFDDNSVPMKVEICVEKDRLHIKWHDHIQTAINKISIAAPGIQFIRTDSKEPSNESTNYIKIGIDNPILKDEVYTCFTNGYPLVHLGEEWAGHSNAGTSIHEILHALGFGHIMKRFDSNLYLKVKTDGLDSNHAYQYTSNPSYGMLTRFDPFSIMMYSENDYMKRAEGDKIWDLKKGPKRMQELSELDKVALNLMYKPCKSNSEYPYSPVLSESTNMLYCGRDVMKSHNQNVPPTISSKCGPNIWANCPSCRVFKDLKTHTGKTIQILGIQRCLNQHKWQGLSGNFYCGVKFALEFHTCRFGMTMLSDGVCGPDQGIPCTDCGKQLKPDYSYTDFNPIPVNSMTDNSTTSSMTDNSTTSSSSSD